MQPNTLLSMIILCMSFLKPIKAAAIDMPTANIARSLTPRDNIGIFNFDYYSVPECPQTAISVGGTSPADLFSPVKGTSSVALVSFGYTQCVPLKTTIAVYSYKFTVTESKGPQPKCAVLVYRDDKCSQKVDSTPANTIDDTGKCYLVPFAFPSPNDTASPLQATNGARAYKLYCDRHGPAKAQFITSKHSDPVTDLTAAMQLSLDIIALGMLNAVHAAAVFYPEPHAARDLGPPPTSPRGYVELEYFSVPECPFFQVEFTGDSFVPAAVDAVNINKNPLSESGYLEIPKSGDFSDPGLSSCLPIKTTTSAQSYKFVTITDERPLPKCNILVYYDGDCKKQIAGAPAVNTRDGGQKCFNIPLTALNIPGLGTASAIGGKSFRLAC